jgi:hypothetical protein
MRYQKEKDDGKEKGMKLGLTKECLRKKVSKSDRRMKI